MIAQCLYQSDPKNLASMGRQRLACQRAARKLQWGVQKERISETNEPVPLESTTYKFAKCLQKRFGLVPGITDRNYITNSYHVHVTEPIDAFTKLKFESEF